MKLLTTTANRSFSSFFVGVILLQNHITRMTEANHITGSGGWTINKLTEIVNRFSKPININRYKSHIIDTISL